MQSHKHMAVGAVVALVWVAAAVGGADVRRVGRGSYATAPPLGGQTPPRTIYATENVRGKMPTNRWWSSLAWVKYSDAQYPHPLAVQAVARGLRIDYPGPNLTAGRDGILGSMPAEGSEDLLLGLSTTDEFQAARVDGFSDWFVRARLATLDARLTVSYGHGSPFVYAICEGGLPRLTFPEVPRIWSGDERSPVLGITVHGKPYALFGPSGSTWQGLGTTQWVNQNGGKPYFSLALLPAGDPKTLALFRRYAYAHVTDTRATPHYDPKTSTVTCEFAVTTPRYEGQATGTILALYPHQWRHTSATLLPGTYSSVRGTMKLIEGSSFTTTLTYPGVLPALPRVGGDASTVAGFLDRELSIADREVRNTYDNGKRLGRYADEVPIAEQYGLSPAADSLRNRIRQGLEAWFTVADADGRAKESRLFCYDDRWGTLIGYPAGYGSDADLNDHHFHYGYFLRAAAEVARRDPAWAGDEQFGGMVKLLIRDIADPDREDPMFPYLRCFDPYAGHSWASGNARFGDGNNQESSSEAVNAWYGLILWGVATHDDALRDWGVWLYTTESTAAREYWLNVSPADFETLGNASVPPWLSMVWGGKGATGTWFSARYEPRHAINYMPVHGGSLYLGLDPDGARRNYEALVRETGGPHFRQWADLIWMYRALSDPDDAMQQYERDAGRTRIEGGNSRANLYHWLTTLKQVGLVDATVTAGTPLYAVFRKGGKRTYVAYNDSDEPLIVHFSDGAELKAPANGYAVAP
jgi:endoglucanase Acf2